jgi:hypothetical protein
MIEEIVGGGNVVEEASNRFRAEQIGFHLEEKRMYCLQRNQGNKKIGR